MTKLTSSYNVSSLTEVRTIRCANLLAAITMYHLHVYLRVSCMQETAVLGIQTVSQPVSRQE